LGAGDPVSNALSNAAAVIRKPSRLMTGMVPPPKPGTLGHRAFTHMARANVRVYRWTGGRLFGTLDGAPLLLLHHVGAKSGVARVMPLVYMPRGDDVVIVASMGGAPKSPAWFHNLKATPDTVVEIGRERRPVRARVAGPDERAELWPLLVEQYAPFAIYEQRTEREIPVLVLEPRPA
jgi:deazaflavin-dependent oxidoreductase (nitroreductase family)